jgi:hypothetical protein
MKIDLSRFSTAGLGSTRDDNGEMGGGAKLLLRTIGEDTPEVS